MELIFEWDVILLSVIRATNIRYIRIFEFSLAELLIEFNSRYTKGVDDFEDILRFKIVKDNINSLISKKGLSLEKVAYKLYIIILDKLGERLLSKRFKLEENLIESIDKKIFKNIKKRMKKKSLIRLKRLT